MPFEITDGSFMQIVLNNAGEYAILSFGEGMDFSVRKIAKVDLSTGKQIGEVVILPEYISELFAKGMLPGAQKEYLLDSGSGVYTFDLSDDHIYQIIDGGEVEEFVQYYAFVNDSKIIGCSYYPGAERTVLSIFER